MSINLLERVGVGEEGVVKGGGTGIVEEGNGELITGSHVINILIEKVLIIIHLMNFILLYLDSEKSNKIRKRLIPIEGSLQQKRKVKLQKDY